MNSTVILLSTFNGEKYLQDQIKSLQNQSLENFTVLWRDDGSNDQTVDMMKKLTQNDERFIEVTEFQSASPRGVIQSFLSLLETALEQKNFEFFFFCDQDDIWDSRKLDVQIEILKKLNPEIPGGTFSDLEIVDEKAELIHGSMHSMLKFNRVDKLWPQLLVQNIVTGCTLAMNKAAAKNIASSKNWAFFCALMHDHWSALVIAATGELSYAPLKLVKYRQHSKNASGGVSASALPKKMKLFFSSSEKGLSVFEERILKIWGQIFALNGWLKTRGSKISTPQFEGHSNWELLNFLIHHNFKAQGLLRTLLFGYGSITLKKKIAELEKELHREFSGWVSNQKKPESESHSQ